MIGTPRLLIVDSERAGRVPAEELAGLLGLGSSHATAGIEQATALLAQGDIPEAVVIDIGEAGHAILPRLEALLAGARSSRVVVVGTLNDLAFYKSLMAQGVADYLTHPVGAAQLAASLSASHAKGPQTASRGMVIAFISAASGDGCSTLALNNAYAFAQELRMPTVLADMDYQFGMVARQLGVQAEFGIRELFEHPERGMDTTLISKMLFAYQGGLKIIAAPERLRLMPSIAPETVREFIAVLRQQFSVVALDLPHLWTAWTAEVLAQADRIVVTSQLSLRSVTHLSRLLGAFNEANIASDKIRIAINRSGARFRETITAQDFERVTLKPVSFYLANDVKTVSVAENQGKTILETGGGVLERQLRDMARALAGQAPGTGPDSSKGKYGFASLLRKK